MNAPNRLCDRAALMRNRRQRRTPEALFLHEEAVLEIQERLIEVNRTFTNPAVVTGCRDIWSNVVPDATVVDDTDTLSLQPASHDLIVHAMTLHWANDPVGQLVQCRHALKPDGLLLVVLLGGQTLHELRASLAEAEIAVTGGLSPRILPMGEVRDYGGLLQRAGLALPVADTLALKTSYGDPMRLMHELRAMGEGNALSDRLRTFTPRAVFSKAAQTYQMAFAKDGRIPATFEFVFLSGWAPADSQPKPLRPGSAKTRLSDALNTPENTIPSVLTPPKD